MAETTGQDREAAPTPTVNAAAASAAPAFDTEVASAGTGVAAVRALSRARSGSEDPRSPGRGGAGAAARGVLAVQRAAGNAAVARMLTSPTRAAPSRMVQREPTTAPPQMLMPRETEPAKIIAEGWRLAKQFGWDGVQLVAAVGNWIHLSARGDPRVHAWAVTHHWLGKGVYMLHGDALVQKTADGHDARARLSETAVAETAAVAKVHGRVFLPDWTDITYVEMHNIGAGMPGPMLLLVGDPAQMRDGLAPDETGPGELHGFRALDSTIQGSAKQPVGGTGAYQMNLDWRGAGIELSDQVLASMGQVHYDWEVRQITASDEQIESTIKQALAARPDLSAKLNPWDTFEHDARRRGKEFANAPGHDAGDLLQALKEGRGGGVLANALNLELLPVQAIATLGGVALDGFITGTGDGRSVGIAWKRPGRYLVKCAAQLDPKTPRTRSARFREDSVAAMVVDVKTAQQLSEDPFTEEDAAAKKLADQTAMLADDAGELSDLAAKSVAQQQEQWVKTKGGVVDVLDGADAKLREAITKRKTEDPLGQTYARLERDHPGALPDPAVVDLEDKRSEVRKRRALAVKRRGWMREKDADRPIYRLPAYYVSSVDGVSYPLLLEVAEPAVLVAGKWWSTDLQDATSSSSEMGRGVYARSPADAVFKALDALAGTLPPGILTARLPAAIPGAERSRSFETRLKDEKATKERLTELATILAIVGLVATGAGAAAIGLAAGIAGAAASAISLIDKWRNGTLAANPLETVMDVVNVCAGFLAGIEAGAVRLIIPKGSKVFFLVPRAERFAGTASRAVIAPAAFAMGDVQVLGDMMEADRQERSGQITAIEGSRRRTQAVVNGVVLTHIGLLADVVKGGAHGEAPAEKAPDGSQGKAGGDPAEGPAGGTRGASYDLDTNSYTAKKTVTDEHGGTRTLEFKQGGLTTVTDDFGLKLSSQGTKAADEALTLIGRKLPEGATLSPVGGGKKFTAAAKDNMVPAKLIVPDARPGATGPVGVDVRVRFVDAVDLPLSGHVAPGGQDLGGPVRLRPKFTAADGWSVEVFVDSRMRPGDLDHAIGHELAEMTELVREHPAGASDDVVTAEMSAGVFVEGTSEPAAGAKPTAHDRAAAWELRSMIDELARLGTKAKPDTIANRKETIKRLKQSMGLDSVANWEAKLEALRGAGFDDAPTVAPERRQVAEEYKLSVAADVADRLRVQSGNANTIFDAHLIEHTFFATFEGGTVSGGHRTAALEELATRHPTLGVREVVNQGAGGTTVRRYELYRKVTAKDAGTKSVYRVGEPFAAAEWAPIIDPITRQTAIKTTVDDFAFLAREGDAAWASWVSTNGLPAPTAGAPTAGAPATGAPAAAAPPVRKFTAAGPSGVTIEGYFDVAPGTSRPQFRTIYPVL